MGLYEFLGIAIIIQLFDISKYFDKEVLVDVMNSLYQAGVTGKLYRLWYTMNCDTEIKVSTPVGMSDTKYTGANVGQGTVGGSLASALSLDTGFNPHFKGSEHEINYGSRRIQPLLYQDDAARICTTVVGAQSGNAKVETIMKQKQLELNLDKTVYIFSGKKDQLSKIRKEIEKSPLTINNREMKQTSRDKYLGDIIHEGGSQKSVDATIDDRYWRIVSA